MKKLLVTLLTLTMAFALIACAGTSPAGGTPAKDQAASTVEGTPAKEQETSTADNKDSAVEPIKIKFSVTQPVSDPQAIYAQQMCDYIEEQSGGKITFEFYPNGELGSLGDVTELISMGSAVMTAVGSDYFSSVAPQMAILNMQYCLTDASQIPLIVESDWFAEQCELVSSKANVKILSWNWFTGYRQMISNFAVNSPEDIAGKKMRVVDNLALPAFATALDCVPVVTAWNEVYTSLSNKMVDVAEAPLATLYASNLYEVADHIAITNHLTSVNMVIMPQALFDSLSDELKALMVEASEKYGEMFSDENLNSQNEYIKKFEEKGVTFTYPNVEEFAAKASAMYKNIGYEDMYAKIQEILSSGK